MIMPIVGQITKKNLRKTKNTVVILHGTLKQKINNKAIDNNNFFSMSKLALAD